MESTPHDSRHVSEGARESPYEQTREVSLTKKILYHLWDADQHLKSPEERALVRKLDFGILICATLGWWMKYIDQSNITNACKRSSFCQARYMPSNTR